MRNSRSGEPPPFIGFLEEFRGSGVGRTARSPDSKQVFPGENPRRTDDLRRLVNHQNPAFSRVFIPGQANLVNGVEWHRRGKPDEVRVHDFLDPTLGKAIPYGVYDVTHNEGWVSVGIDHDTARFAAEALRRWWRKMGSKRYPRAKELLITADGGGSNGSRSRLWKVALQELADRLGLRLTVCHFPPGTSKWNKIEHRMFSHITMNWRGKPLVSHEVNVQLITNPTPPTPL